VSTFGKGEGVTPKVSLVTPSYNQASFIERTLRSVLCQDYPNVEYLVIDGLSGDGTQDVLRRYEHALDGLVIERDDGQGDALDKGFRLASGDILGYLNADDCLASAQTLTEVVRRFGEHRSADVIYGGRYYVGDKGQFLNMFPYRPFRREALYRADYIPQEAAFWRREIYERAGGFINTDYQFAMDYELWLRFLSVGARFVSVPEYWGLFRYHANQKSNAAWESQGLPEIARLYRQYADRLLSDDKMQEYIKEHFTGCHPAVHPHGHEMFKEMWHRLVLLHAHQLHADRIDGWVDRAPLNPVRLERLARRRAA
jgi:glycosyltransferase involved in cell wall biosynthesis